MFCQILLISRHLLLSLLFVFIIFFNVLLADNNTTNTTINDTNNSSATKYECRITKYLYKMFVGKPWHGLEDSPKIYCSRPGCFYIQEQRNFGWIFPSFLNELLEQKKVLMGCRSDIPYLLWSTSQNIQRTQHMRLYRTMMSLRACFIGIKEKDTKIKEKCQAESNNTIQENGELISNQTWIGRFLPSAQERCFLKFEDGIFFVHDDEDGQDRIVCCSSGTNTPQEEINFRQKCKEVSFYINNIKKWRITDN